MAPFLPLLAAGTVAAAYLDAKYHIASDVSALLGARRGAKAIEALMASRGEDDWGIYTLFNNTLLSVRSSNQSDKDCLIFEDRRWSYEDVAVEIGRLANEFTRRGVNNEDVVAMVLDNSPEIYFAMWACWKIGAVPAPVNTSLTRAPLKHCLSITLTKIVITSWELLPMVQETILEYQSETEAVQALVYDYNTYQAPSSTSLDVLLHSSLPTSANVNEYSPPSKRVEDPAMLLFTSGTTGKPKAVKWPCGYSSTAGSPRWPYIHQPTDRWFVCLPCFHGTAMWAVIVPSIGVGSTIVLTRKFSTTNFWKQVTDGRANAIVYVGELCRYLVQAPKSPFLEDEKTSHDVRKVYGLGMSPIPWKLMRERFGIPVIYEYFSSTEATGALINVNTNEFGLGRVAKMGPILKYMNRNIVVVKIDPRTQDLYRHPRTGFCQLADPGTPGEVLSKHENAGILKQHEYFNNESATDEKLVRDVFVVGDTYTRIGDLLEYDHDGFIAFRDRLGDTFRAKGHNVSTTEVESALSSHPAVESANVFPIAMNQWGYEGQVGCAVVTLRDSSIIPGLEKFLQEEAGLPVYAVPKFLKVAATDDGGVTSIFKKDKKNYKADGFTIAAGSADRVHWIKKEQDGYVPFTKADEAWIVGGKAQL